MAGETASAEKFEDGDRTADDSATDLIQVLELEQLKERLEKWRSVGHPVSRLLCWEENYYPVALFGGNTALFLLFRYSDISVLTVACLGCALFALADELLPLLHRTFRESMLWTAEEHLEYQRFCKWLLSASNYSREVYQTLCGLRREMPHIFTAGLCGTFIVSALVFNRMSGMAIAYLLTTCLLALPGMYANSSLHGALMVFRKKLLQASQSRFDHSKAIQYS